MIVGEAPGAEEERYGEPFIGASGKLLTELLHAAGITRTACFISNVCRHRPPGNDISEWISDNVKTPVEGWERVRGRWVHPHVARGVELLEKELESVRPKLVIALGGTALWALTGHTGILKWRGSRLSPPHRSFTVVPSVHPAAVLRELSLRSILQQDLKRARLILEGKQVPRHYNFTIAPGFLEAESRLKWLLQQADKGPLRLAGDIETRTGHIACFGIAWSPTDAICIPILQAGAVSPFYWALDDEVELVSLIRRLHSHPNITWLGQNYLYDCQYYHRFLWGIPRNVLDTMIGHHSIFATMRKGLDFLSSMYCHDHVYWKDESKDWAPALGERQLWEYNSKDACITYEAAGEIEATRDSLGVQQHFAFQQSLFHPVLRMMNRGVRIDYSKRAALRKQLLEAAIQRQDLLNFMAGHELNPKSSKQILAFFYNDLKIPGIKNLKTDKLTSGSEALEQIANREPLLVPLCQTIAELRSVGVFLKTFVEAEPDIDGRMRSAFAVAGTHSYRFSSSENAFGSGMNFQNLPVKEKQKISKAKDYLKLPNIRDLFIPDEGYTFFDMDLDRADLQVVVWEADDRDLKFALRENLDMHMFNAMQVWDLPVPADELQESHPNYKEHKARFAKQRQLAKQAVHATNYGVGDRKLAITIGITVNEASKFRRRWFAAHPGVEKWHKRTEAEALSSGYIENKLGARLYIMGRFDLPEALAWGPQSTVAGVINRALHAIDEARERGDSRTDLLLQVHDSLAGQFPTADAERELVLLSRLGRVVIPYDDPLIIPTGIKTSTISWGQCE